MRFEEKKNEKNEKARIARLVSLVRLTNCGPFSSSSRSSDSGLVRPQKAANTVKRGNAGCDSICLVSI